MSKRTRTVIMTNEARVLKQFREKAGLSMRQAGEKMGISNSLVSQIENGRENIPSGQRLQKFLDCYGVAFSTYKTHVKEFKQEQTDRQVIETLLSKVRPKDMKTLRVMIEHFVSEI